MWLFAGVHRWHAVRCPLLWREGDTVCRRCWRWPWRWRLIFARATPLVGVQGHGVWALNASASRLSSRRHTTTYTIVASPLDTTFDLCCTNGCISGTWLPSSGCMPSRSSGRTFSASSDLVNTAPKRFWHALEARNVISTLSALRLSSQAKRPAPLRNAKFLLSSRNLSARATGMITQALAGQASPIPLNLTQPTCFPRFERIPRQRVQHSRLRLLRVVGLIDSCWQREILEGRRRQISCGNKSSGRWIPASSLTLVLVYEKPTRHTQLIVLVLNSPSTLVPATPSPPWLPEQSFIRHTQRTRWGSSFEGFSFEVTHPSFV